MGVDAVVRALRAARRRRGFTSEAAADLAPLRLELRRSLEHALRAVGGADSRGSFVDGLASTAAYLTRVGAELDGDLALAQQEPDPRVRALWGDWLGDRVAEHRRLCAGLRRQAHREAARRGAGQLSLASDQQAFLEAGMRITPNRLPR